MIENADASRFDQKISRTDPVAFRCAVPAMVGHFRIHEVMGYQPGGKGAYAYAYALSTANYGETWCTHRIIAQDDAEPAGTVRWTMESGNYDFSSRTQAVSDLVIRAFPYNSFLR